MSPITPVDTQRYELRVRHLTVARSEEVAPAMLRVTLTGSELEGFTAAGPADHVKVFFPLADEHGALGEIVAPQIIDGRPVRPDGPAPIVRDYTPAAFRPGTAGTDPELDIDFFTHGDGGPAVRWAISAQPGDPAVIAGPRGSHLPPEGIERAIIVADETALPAAQRWIATLGEIPTVGLLSVSDPATRAYLEAEDGAASGVGTAELLWFSGPSAATDLETALRAIEIDEHTFVFLAGEATTIMPLRRYLRRELDLTKHQVDAHGYWKRGEANLDHHAPLDPSDPD
ncbi:siderophore-interacting protein [Leucobacter sp. GX24907]